MREREILARMELLDEQIRELTRLAEEQGRLKRLRDDSRRFWLGVLIPAAVALLAAGSSEVVTIVYRK